MKAKMNIGLSLPFTRISALLLATLALSSNAWAQNLIIYPAPKGPLISEVFSMTVNDKSCPVYKTGVFNNDFSYFDFHNPPVKVEVTVLDSALAIKFRRGSVVRPLSKGIRSTVNGNVISFVLTEPSKIMLEPAEYIGDRWDSEIRLGPLLYLFTNTIEENQPDPESKDVVYFKPGFHDHTKTPILLKSNTTYYIAGGAWVRAKAIKGNGVENIKISGHGVLELSILDPTEGEKATGSGNSIHLADCQNITFQGITYLSHGYPSMIHMLTRCRNIAFDNYKIIGGSSYWYDGIHLEGTDGVTINNCFIRADDDPIAVYSDWTNPDGPLFSGNVTVTNCIINNCGQGNICRIGWWEYWRITLSKNIAYKNIDVVHQGTGNTTYDNSIVSFSEGTLDRPFEYENISFENINIEDCSRFLHINLENSKHGKIKGLIFKKINFMTLPRRVSYLGANDFDFITFEDLIINGKRINNICDLGATLSGEAALHPEKIIFLNSSIPQNAPAAPSDLRTITYIDRVLQIDLWWKDNSTNETGFFIERKTGTTGEWKQLTTVGPDVTYFTDNSVANDVEYFYRVRANNGELVSDYSNEVNATASMK